MKRKKNKEGRRNSRKPPFVENGKSLLPISHESRTKTKWFGGIVSALDLSIVGVMSLFLTYYQNTEPRIFLVTEGFDLALKNDSEPVQYAILEDGRYAIFNPLILEFGNSSIRSGYIDSLEITVQGLNPEVYTISTLWIERKKVSIFENERVKMEIFTLLHERLMVNKTTLICIKFRDNRDNPVLKEDGNEAEIYMSWGLDK